MRDATVAALSDAQFVAPLVQTADLLSAGGTSGIPKDDTSPKAFFYVFDYQTKDGDYPQVRIWIVFVTHLTLVIIRKCICVNVFNIWICKIPTESNPKIFFEFYLRIC